MSLMAAEAREAPEAVFRFLKANADRLDSLGEKLRVLGPSVIITCARGSSDHAAGYFKYLEEILVGIPCASIGASVVSVYGSKLQAKNALCLAISQSGKSPDIVALQKGAREAGAITVALVNAEDSDLANGADLHLPLLAGPEKSVAATKSVIVSCAAAAFIVASWKGDLHFRNAIIDLPNVLEKALLIKWDAVEDMARSSPSIFTLGRGPALPIASETALKLKETCALHAEAFSTAEVMHGPMELVGHNLSALAFVPEDAAAAQALKTVAHLKSNGARIEHVGRGGLDYAQTQSPLLDPISMLLTAYLTIERIAQARGRDPDKPRLLKKVTETT